MLEVHQISKSYGAQVILEAVTFVINPGERAGLVGPNGCGKTTLLRIITGVEQPDRGHVRLAPEAVLGYLPQQPDLTSGRNMAQEVRAGIEGLEAAQQQMDTLAARMASARSPDLDNLMQAYGEALTRFESLGGYAVDHRIAEVLSGLGLGGVPTDVPIDNLSGGQRMRVGLARLLLTRPDLLLLDEPTNHLDIQALEWLEDFLGAYGGAALIVSHDRTFLDNTVTRILELDEGTHRVTAYPGNYSLYAEVKVREADKHRAAWKDQQAEIRRLKTDIQRTKDQARSTERGTTDSSARRLAKKVAKKARARERRLERYLESTDQVEPPQDSWRLKLDFSAAPRSGQVVATLDDMGHTFNGPWLFRGVNLTLLYGQRVALLGPNASGKTTLLRIIVGEVSPGEGSARLGSGVRLGYMPQGQENLDSRDTPLALIRRQAPLSETEARNFLHYFLFSGDEVFVPVADLSSGERARLILARLVVSGANFLLLDEPINHLDIPSRDRFLAALAAFPGTVLAVVHDRAFIERFATDVWSLEDRGIQHLPGGAQ